MAEPLQFQTVEHIYLLLRNAAISKRSLSAIYKGYERHFSPHIIGIRNGKFWSLSYQYGGASSSGLAAEGSSNNWRCFEIERLSRVKERNDSWQGGPAHSRPQSCIDQVDVDSAKPQTHTATSLFGR